VSIRRGNSRIRNRAGAQSLLNGRIRTTRVAQVPYRVDRRGDYASGASHSPSPRDPLVSSWYSQTGAVHLLQSRTSEAIAWFEKARSANPLRPIVHAHLASAHALTGETEHAVAELAEARRLSGDDRYSSIGRLKALGYLGATKIRTLYEATYFSGLRKAGMPEE